MVMKHYLISAEVDSNFNRKKVAQPTVTKIDPINQFPHLIAEMHSFKYDM